VARAAKGRPASITADDIVAAGIAVTKASGLGALSMQAVADRLGVSTRSLYHHVGGIAEIRQAVVAQVVSLEVELSPDLDPHDWLVGYARRMREHFAAHPGVAGHVLDYGWLDPSVLLHLERCTAAFEAAGIEEDEAVLHAVMFLWWIATFVARETSSWAPENVPPDPWAEFPGRLPRLLMDITIDQLFDFELGQVVAVTRSPVRPT
jgi:AcrR family transcriptional regulator